MREIKFRAWDESRMKGLKKNDFFSIRNDGYTSISLPSSNEPKLMQYTGLTDKNGVEIYEGDIVKFKWLGEYTGVIKYEDCGFGLSYNANDEQMNVAMRRFYFDKNAEVIGNIHENPELLEAKS